MVEFILIFVTLATAVVGTATAANRNIKIALITLAVATSVGTLVQTVSTNRENEINKKLIVSLVQASNPPEYFSHDLVKAIDPLLDEKSLFVSGQTVFKDTGERILAIGDGRTNTDELAGLLYISKKAMNPIYYAYAIDGDVGKPVSDLIGLKWVKCQDHWEECINELSAVSKIAMEIAPIEVVQTTATMDSNDLTFRLESGEHYAGRPIIVEFNKTFIESLYGIPAIERGRMILSQGQSYILDQL